MAIGNYMVVPTPGELQPKYQPLKDVNEVLATLIEHSNNQYEAKIAYTEIVKPYALDHMLFHNDTYNTIVLDNDDRIMLSLLLPTGIELYCID